MNVKIRSIGPISSLLGRQDMNLALPAGSTIDGLLLRLREMGGDQLGPDQTDPMEESAQAPLRVMVNGRDINALQGRGTILEDCDEVLVFVPIAGG